MKKIVKTVDEKRGIIQFTVLDERHYFKPIQNPTTGVPEITAVPSVTWIISYWPNKFLEEWRAKKGYEDAEEVKIAAGDRGSAVHEAIDIILQGEEFRIDTKVQDKRRSTPTETVMRELTFEELVGVQSFIAWRDEVKPEIIAHEIVVFSDIHGYAGTVDLVCRIDGVPYVIDFKTGKTTQRTWSMQVSAYRTALENGENPLFEEDGKTLVDMSGCKTAILQVGDDKNKAGYKFTEIEDAFPLFKVAQQIWKAEVGDNTPGFTKRDFPIVLSPKAEKVEPLPSPEDDGPEAEGNKPIKTKSKTK